MAKQKTSQKQPIEMYLLALTEMCQRFAFWGVGNLLVLYLVQYHKLPDSFADHLFGIFTGVAFVLPVLGGYLADRMNYRMPVIWGSILTALGCFLIATGNMSLTITALALIAIGGAIFTPSIYALLGNLYHKHHHLRDAGFSIYYASVNIGVFFAMIILGYFGQAHYWNIAFIIAGCIQMLGLWPFYVVLRNPQIMKVNADHAERKTVKKIPLHKHEKSRIFVICILAFFSILFWMAYNQGGSSMNLFALRFTDRHIGSFEMPPTWLLSSESLYLVLFAIPLAKLYTYLSRKKLDPTPPMKSTLSMFAMGICFLIMVIGASEIPSGARTAAISPFFSLSAFALMALGEMLICPIGLSLITHISPRRYTAMLIGIWYLCIGAGFYLGGVAAPLMTSLKSLSGFFGIFVVVTFACGLVLLMCTKKLNKMRHLDTL